MQHHTTIAVLAQPLLDLNLNITATLLLVLLLCLVGTLLDQVLVRAPAGNGYFVFEQGEETLDDELGDQGLVFGAVLG